MADKSLLASLSYTSHVTAMFTGLVEEVGRVLQVKEEAEGRTIKIAARKVLEDVSKGDSISINGACQTVEQFGDGWFAVFSIPETLKATNFGDFQEGTQVNLERALQLADRLGGHIVQGHVERVASVAEVTKQEKHWDVAIELSSPYLIEKGSITINGISLTVQKVESDRFWVQIIPETIANTNIGSWQKGTAVNIETDYLVKVVDHLTEWRHSRSK